MPPYATVAPMITWHSCQNAHMWCVIRLGIGLGANIIPHLVGLERRQAGAGVHPSAPPEPVDRVPVGARPVGRVVRPAKLRILQVSRGGGWEYLRHDDH